MPTPTTAPAEQSVDTVTNAVTFPPPGSPIGKPISRVDGKLKVTGHAKYAADAAVEGALAAVLVRSPIAKGSVRSADISQAAKMPGIIKVLVAGDDIGIKPAKSGQPQMLEGILGEERVPLSDKEIAYAGQYIAAVVAKTLDQARHAADLIAFSFDQQEPILSPVDKRADMDYRKKREGQMISTEIGDVPAAADKAAAAGGVVITSTYDTPVETHNPMELHATIASWQGNDKLTVWDATQYVKGVQNLLSWQFNLKQDNIRVISPFLGGGFGCKGAMWTHVTLCVALAKMVGKPVRLMLTRQQMFTGVGHRPATTQAMAIAAGKDGKIAGLAHDTASEGSLLSDFIEPAGQGTSRVLYATENLAVRHYLSKINKAPPTFMRAPGEAPGMFALESAIDELAIALKMDPVKLRLLNDPEVSPAEKKPFSSKHLKEAFELGAEKFGWSKYNPAVGSMKHPSGRAMGWGVSTAVYPANRFPGSGRIRLMKGDDGGLRAIGASSAQEIGTGGYTAYAQIVAAQVGLPLDRVKYELGDSVLPFASVAGGSNQTASVGQAMADATYALKLNLLKIADEAGIGTLAECKPQDVSLRDGKLVWNKDSSAAIDLRTLIDKSGRAYVEGYSGKPDEVGKANQPSGEDYTAVQKKYSLHSHGAHFVEVIIDSPCPMVRVSRVVSVMDIGTVINPKTAASQVIGGVVGGIGMALHEATHYDHRTGKPVNDNLADYAMPVNADVPDIEVHFVGKPDYKFNAIGCRGVGEIGITGVAAAIANAVFHATGKRIRDLPITPDKLL